MSATSHKRNRNPLKPLRCSFCQKSQDVVEKLITSPSSSRPSVYICNECVFVCNSVIEDSPRLSGESSDSPGAGTQKQQTRFEQLQQAIGLAEQAGTNEAKVQAYEAIRELVPPLFNHGKMLERALRVFLESEPE